MLFKVEMFETVADLKSYIEEEQGVASTQMKLFYEGKELEKDNWTIANYDIKDNFEYTKRKLYPALRHAAQNFYKQHYNVTIFKTNRNQLVPDRHPHTCAENDILLPLSKIVERGGALFNGKEIHLLCGSMSPDARRMYLKQLYQNCFATTEICTHIQKSEFYVRRWL